MSIFCQRLRCDVNNMYLGYAFESALKNQEEKVFLKGYNWARLHTREGYFTCSFYRQFISIITSYNNDSLWIMQEKFKALKVLLKRKEKDQDVDIYITQCLGQWSVKLLKRYTSPKVKQVMEKIVSITKQTELDKVVIPSQVVMNIQKLYKEIDVTTKKWFDGVVTGKEAEAFDKMLFNIPRN